jgi:hypothetical protein
MSHGLHLAQRPFFRVMALATVAGASACFPDPSLLDPDDVVLDNDTSSDTTASADAPECGGNTDCAMLAGPCVDAICDGGRCTTTVRDGLSCDDGDLCTTDDVCIAEVCKGTAKACDAPGACQGPGSCDTATGTCSYPTLGNGTACDDGDRCTAGDSCLDGACIPTRSPDDQFGDWTVTFSGSAGVKAGAMVRLGSDIGVAVEFAHDDTETAPWVQAHASRSSSSPRIAVEQGARYGVALFRISANGSQIVGDLVAESQHPISVEGLAAGPDGTWFMSGRITEAARLGPASGGRYDVVTGPEGTSWYGIRLGFRPQWTRAPWLVDRGIDTSSELPIRFLSTGSDCVMVMNVAGGNLAKVRRDGITVAEVEGPEGHLQAVWLGWDQDCSGSLSVQRMVRTSSGGQALFWDAAATEDGGLALGGVARGDLVMEGPQGTSVPIFSSDTPSGFAIVLGSDKKLELSVSALDSRVAADSSYADAMLPLGVMLSADRLVTSFVAMGVVNVDVRRSGQSVASMFAPGNPPSRDDILPRAVVMDFGRRTAVNERGSVITGGEFKGFSPTAVLAAGGGAGDFVETSNVDCCDTSLDHFTGFDLFRVYVAGMPSWSGTFMQRQTTKGPFFTGPLLLQTLADGPSLIVAASIAGDAIQVGGTRIEPGAGHTAFVARVNSDNQFACRLGR